MLLLGIHFGRDARAYGHTTTAMHDMSTPLRPPARLVFSTLLTVVVLVRNTIGTSFGCLW